MKPALATVHMKNAENYATLSKAVRAKVGAVLVTASGVEVPGFNGTPSGTDNACETKVWLPNETSFGDMGEWTLVTKPEVLHAETNVILKCAREGISCIGATLFVTMAPCKPCAAMIKQSGINSVFYRDSYRDMFGADYLNDNGVPCAKLSLTE